MSNIPEGFKLVPVEPTKEQILSVCMHPDLSAALYRSMIKAAPVPPQADALPFPGYPPVPEDRKIQQADAQPMHRQPDAIIEGVRTSVGITHAIYASTVSLKHGEQVKLYTRPDAGEVERLRAERDALQQRLTAADERIDELTAQPIESRRISLSGCEFSEDELIRRAVRAASGTSRRGTQRWVAMKDAFGCGSGVANALCRRFGFDPDETVKP